ncbi:V4R domain-containing protein [Thermococcus aciditolerans]|nr:V4R domain-containing protein [Thermococcus aciditolerans]
MIPLGMKRLDEVLGGGIEEGSSLAFVGSICRDNIVLMHQLVFNLLKAGYRVLIVEFRQSPDMLRKELLHYNIDYSGFVENGQLRIFDGFSNLYGVERIQGANVLSNPLDLGITSAVIRDTMSGGGFDFLVIDDLNVLYTLQSNSKAYLRAIVRLVNSIKRKGFQTFAAFSEDVFERSDLTAGLMPFDYVFEVKDGYITLRRSLQPLKVPSPRMPYVKTELGVEDILERHTTLESIKRDLWLDEMGNLWLGDTRVQLINEDSEASLVEFVYEYLGPEDGKRFLYLWGRKEFIGIGRAARNQYDNLRDALLSVKFATESSGGGRIEIVEVQEDFVVLRGRNLFPSRKGYSYQFHINYAGELSQFLTEFTGEQWEGEEVKCQSIGSEYCEFVFRRKK